jgi:hypothetical protein
MLRRVEEGGGAMRGSSYGTAPGGGYDGAFGASDREASGRGRRKQSSYDGGGAATGEPDAISVKPKRLRPQHRALKTLYPKYRTLKNPMDPYSPKP